MIMKIAVIDTETTAKPVHDPYNPNAKLIYVGVYDGSNYTDFSIEYRDSPYSGEISRIATLVATCHCLVLANGKFDLAWLRRYGIRFADKKIWDVLLVQFILNHQMTSYNSLNEVADQWELGQKLDVVKEEYWNKGLDTTDVPEDILRDYLKQDVMLTHQVYELQLQEVMDRGILPLIRLHNADLLMLQEMEWNGNKYASHASRTACIPYVKEIRKIKRLLNELTPIKPKCWSWQFISNLLYGGFYKYKVYEAYTFTYKDGSTKEKFHWVEKSFELLQLVKPPKVEGSGGYWPTDEGTLRGLKASGTGASIIKQLLALRGVEKLLSTYLKGFPARIKECNWENDLIHTNYSQVTAVTGRLSSTKPNVQNNPPAQKEFFITRY